MKITIATGPIFPVPAVRGGAVQRMWEGLSREFAARGHEVTIFAREFPGQPREEILDGIRYVRRGGYAQSASIIRDLLQCLVYALKVAGKVPPGDVVVTNDFWLPALLPRLNASAGKVIPCLQRFPKHQCCIYGRCATLVAVSQAVADAVRCQSPSVASKVALVPNAVDEAFLGGAKRPHRGEDHPVRILYVGRIHPEKGLELLAEALRDMGRGAEGRGLGAWECVLVGPVAEAEGGGGEAFAGRIRELTNGLPVRIEAPVYEAAALAAIYDHGDIFVYPSIAEAGESFGIAPLEAMARHAVPVVSNLRVFREYLVEGANGFVFDHRSALAARGLSSLLQELIADRSKREKIGTEARLTAEKFSAAVIAERYLKLFGNTLQSAQ